MFSKREIPNFLFIYLFSLISQRLTSASKIQKMLIKCSSTKNNFQLKGSLWYLTLKFTMLSWVLPYVTWHFNDISWMSDNSVKKDGIHGT